MLVASDSAALWTISSEITIVGVGDQEHKHVYWRHDDAVFLPLFPLENVVQFSSFSLAAIQVFLEILDVPREAVEIFGLLVRLALKYIFCNDGPSLLLMTLYLFCHLLLYLVLFSRQLLEHFLEGFYCDLLLLLFEQLLGRLMYLFHGEL